LAVFVVALALTCPGAAHAADAAGNYAIWGAGGRSCNQYLRSAGAAPARQAFKDFLMGYLTAYNATSADTYNALGAQSLEKALDKLDEYCGVHKMDSFDRAITHLVLTNHHSRTRSPLGSAGASAWGRAPVPTATDALDATP
jgi:hypothetical protein